MVATYPANSNFYYQVETTATTDIPIEVITSPGVIFPSIKSQKEIEDEIAKRKKDEKMRLKLNRKNMFSKKGRY